MKLQVKKGVTSKLLQFFIQDSSVTTGAGLTGLVFNSSGLSAYYYREGAASATSITLATMTAGTWATGGFVAVDGTNLPGVYQLGLPDAALATGANSVVVMLKGATNMAPVLMEIQLTDIDINDGVRAGLTALPNVASGSAGAIPTTGTGANQISLSSGLVTLAGVTHTGAVIPTVTTVTNSPILATGTASAGAANTITLQTAVGANNVIVGASINIVGGTGIGQTRGVIAYDNSTKIATVDRPFTVTPDNTSVYVVAGGQVQPILTLNAGTAQAGASTSITLASGASATDNLYNECSVQIVGGTGVGQIRAITGYVGSTKVATVDRAWSTNPDSTSIYVVVLANLAATNGSGAISTVSAVSGAVGSVTGNVGGNVVGTVASVTGNVGGNVTGSVGSVTGSVGSVTSAVTVGTNNDKTSYSLAALDSLNLHSGTAQTGSTSTTIKLASGAESTNDNLYRGCVVKIYGGTGASQARVITAYTASTRVATVDRAWIVTPDNTSTYAVLALDLPASDTSLQVVASGVNGNVTGSVGSVTGNVGGNITGSVGSVATGGITSSTFAANALGAVWDELRGSHTSAGTFGQAGQIVRSGTAQAGASTSITLDAGASSSDSFYVNDIVFIVSGTGAGQARFITGYTGSTKVATVTTWVTNPDSSSVFVILPFDAIPGATAPTASQNAQAVWNELRLSHTTAGTFGEGMASVQGNVTGSVGSVTGNVGGNVAGSVGSVTNAVTVGTNNDKTGYGLSSLESFVLASGTASAGAATTVTLAGASTTDNLYNGEVVKIYGGTGAGQARVITGYVGSTKVATVDRAWATNPDNTSLFAVLSLSEAKLDSSLQTTAASVQGNVTGSVGSVASGGITTTSFGTGAIDSNAFAQTAADKIWSSTTRTLSAFSTSLAQSVWDVLESAIGTASSIGVKVKTALPAISPGSNGGLPTTDANNAVKVQSGTGANQINLSSGNVSLSAPDSQIVNSGTATAGSSTTITLPAGASGTDQLYRGMLIKVTGGTGSGQARSITDYTSRVVTVDRSWITDPDNTSTYAVVFTDIPKVDSSGQVVAASVQGNVTGSVGSVTGAVGSVTGNVGGNVVGSVASVTGAVGSVTGNVGGNVTGSVGSVVGNVGGNVVGSVASVTNAVTVGTNNDKTGYSLTTLESSILVSGTASAGSSTTLTLAGASTTTNLYNGLILKIYGGTGAGQARVITAYNSSRVATVDTPWITTPDATSQFAVLAIEAAKLDSGQQVTAASVQGNVTGSVGSVSGNVGGNVAGSVASVAGDVSGNVVGSVGSLASQAQTDVKSQVVAALVTDTYAEVSGVPAATSSLKDKLNWIFALARNKITQTSTTQTLRNDSDTTSVATAATSDDGTTYTRNKFS